MTSKLMPTVVVMLAAVLFLAGCALDNGMPRDLARHLASQQIILHPKRTSAPLSSRAGVVFAAYDSVTMARVIRIYGLRRWALEDPQWVSARPLLGPAVTPSQVWGITGRPAQFRLRDGGQFEYFYLVVTTTGEMCMLAEYAYG